MIVIVSECKQASESVSESCMHLHHMHEVSHESESLRLRPALRAVLIPSHY